MHVVENLGSSVYDWHMAGTAVSPPVPLKVVTPITTSRMRRVTLVLSTIPVVSDAVLPLLGLLMTTLPVTRKPSGRTCRVTRTV